MREVLGFWEPKIDPEFAISDAGSEPGVGSIGHKVEGELVPAGLTAVGALPIGVVDAVDDAVLGAG